MGMPFISSPLQFKRRMRGHNVLGEKQNCRPVRKLLQSSCLSSVDTAEAGRNRCSHGRWQRLEQSKLSLFPHGGKM